MKLTKILGWVPAGSADPGDFAPEIVKAHSRPPSPLPRAVLYALLALFALLIIWATVGQLDIVAVSQGKLVPQSFLKIVQPAEPGIVRDRSSTFLLCAHCIPQGFPMSVGNFPTTRGKMGNDRTGSGTRS